MDINSLLPLLLAAAAIAIGLLLLIKGGDWTIDAAVFIAERSGLSPLFIGATILSFGTSVPELFTSINANLSGYPGISLGNVLGSNVANILIVLGATALVMPIGSRLRALWKDLAMMLLATALLAFGMYQGILTRGFGAVMFVILVAFVTYQYFTDSLPLEDEADDDEAAHVETMKGAMILLVLGLAALALGAELLVEGAVAAGTALGISEAVIGMTVVAFGTSLPELSTCIAAARRRSVGLVLGNIIGSNTFNILSILGLTAMVKALDVPEVLMGRDLLVVIAVSVGFALWMMFVKTITRPVGALMVLGYVGFIGMQFLG